MSNYGELKKINYAKNAARKYLFFICVVFSILCYNTTFVTASTDPLECVEPCFKMCNILECVCDVVEIQSNANGSLSCNFYQYDDLIQVKNEGLFIDEYFTTVVVAESLRKHFNYAQVSFTHEDGRPEMVLNDSISYIPVDFSTSTYLNKTQTKTNNSSSSLYYLPTRLHAVNFDFGVTNENSKTINAHAEVLKTHQ